MRVESVIYCLLLLAICRYPRITADEVEAEMEEMAAAIGPLLPPPGGLFCSTFQ